ncbi:MAG: hypothetical protein P4L99_25450 [Chthoniobacter sp.]|nr:hypothetical protein [Chthoniobacter sp.]
MQTLHGGNTFGAQLEQPLCVGKERAPFLGQRNSIVRTIQQAHADIALEIAHLPGERRLGEAESSGALGKTQFFSDGDEIPQVPKFNLLVQSSVMAAMDSI